MRLCARSEPVNQAVANNSIKVKATDKFDIRVSRVRQDLIPLKFLGKGRGQGHVTPKF